MWASVSEQQQQQQQQTKQQRSVSLLSLTYTHDYFLKSRVTRPLSDSVDGALELPGPIHRPCEGVRCAQAQVVLAVSREDYVVGTFHVLAKHAWGKGVEGGWGGGLEGRR